MEKGKKALHMQLHKIGAIVVWAVFGNFYQNGIQA